MMFELGLVRAATPPADTLAQVKTPAAPLRRAIREASDCLIMDALRRDDLATLSTSCVQLMLAAARAIDARGVDPQVDDFVTAACSLVDESRTVIDRGLMLDDGTTTRAGGVMLELCVHGIMGALNLPYADIAHAVMAGADVRTMLVRLGRLTAPTPEGDDDDTGAEAGPPDGPDAGHPGGAGADDRVDAGGAVGQHGDSPGPGGP